MSNKYFNSQKTSASLNQFTEALGVGKKVTIEDGALTARVIGEFSAGKTRLIRELLNDVIPAELYPVSSLERQTKLQLEITYGEAPSLKLIQKENDFDQAKVIGRFKKFPERHQIDEQYTEFDYRLRLEIPETKFVLPEGDGYGEEKIPMKLFLIDTPGWNSGNDPLADGDVRNLITGEHNLALVYVSNASRLDSQTNIDKLKQFLEILSESSFLGSAHLVFVITHCESQNHDRFEEKTQEYVRKIWEDDLGESIDDLTLRIMCVDFQELDQDDLDLFRDEFWWNLLEPLGEQKKLDLKSTVLSKVEKWQDEWQFIPMIQSAIQQLEANRQMLQKAYVEGEFIKGLNMTRLMYMSDAEIQKKCFEAWLRQVNFTDISTLKNNLVFNQRLNANHPLSHWWNDYFLANMQNALNPVEHFFKQFMLAIKSLHEKTSDLNQYLENKIYDDYVKALFALDSSFCQLLIFIEPMLYIQDKDQNKKQEFLANLLSLSIVQSRFLDHHTLLKS